MDTFIVRVHRGMPDGRLRGLVGRPGDDEVRFTTAEELVAALAADQLPDGKGAGSMSSSPIREE